VPLIRGIQITGGLEVFGDQCSVFTDRFEVALFEGGGDSPVHFGRSDLSCDS
jgi:hypothetical protein